MEISEWHSFQALRHIDSDMSHAVEVVEFNLDAYTAAEEVVLPQEFFPTETSMTEARLQLAQQATEPWEMIRDATITNVVTGDKFDAEFRLSYADEGEDGPCTYCVWVFLR